MQRFAVLNHGGNFSLAAAALRNKNYGSISRLPFNVKGHTAPEDDEDEPLDDAPEEPYAPGSFPTDLLNVPGFIGEVMAYNLATCIKRQPVLALAGALALLSVLTGRKVMGPDGLRTNLYIVSVARSGKGKEHARRVNKRILESPEVNAVGLIGPDSLHSESALVNWLAQHPATLLQIDEMGRFLQTLSGPRVSSHLASISTALMKLYTSSDTTYRGSGHADLTRNVVINQPHAVIYGTSTKVELDAAFTAKDVSNGVLSRNLIFDGLDKPEKVKRPKGFDARIPESILQFAAYWEQKTCGPGNLSQINPEPDEISVDDEADTIFDALDEHADAEQDRLSDCPAATIWTRAVENAMKLAALYAISRAALGELAVIDKVAAAWGCSVSRHLTAKFCLAGTPQYQ